MGKGLEGQKKENALSEGRVRCKEVLPCESAEALGTWSPEQLWLCHP